MEKSAALTEYDNKVLRMRAKEMEKERRFRELIDKDHPVMSKATLSPVQKKLMQWGARRQAYVADLEPKELAKAINPFAGMGSKGQKHLDKLMQKESAWTDYGQKLDEHRSKKMYRMSRRMHQINQEEPEMAAAAFSYLAPWAHELQGRRLAYTSQLEGAGKLKQLIPFIGMGDAGKRDLKKILKKKKTEKTAEYKELSKDSPTEDYKGPLAAVLGSTAVGAASSGALLMSLKNELGSVATGSDKAKELEDTSKDVIKHFKQKGVDVSDVDLGTQPTQSRFNPITNKTYSSKYTPDILAHELGHADNARKFQKTLGRKGGKAFQIAGLPLQNVVAGGQDLGPIGRTPVMGLAALPLMSDKVTDKLRGGKKDSARNKAVDFIQDHPEAVAAGAVSPLLIEEGRASKKALDAIKKVKPERYGRSAKRLGSAFGTYAGFAALPVGAAYLYGKTKKHHKENNE